jgi:hypothetical protein
MRRLGPVGALQQDLGCDDVGQAQKASETKQCEQKKHLFASKPVTTGTRT